MRMEINVFVSQADRTPCGDEHCGAKDLSKGSASPGDVCCEISDSVGRLFMIMILVHFEDFVFLVAPRTWVRTGG
jgi:hypothetical protein